MPKGKRYNKRDLPPNPDPESYILVQSADGKYHYRLKRGLNKPAFLNSSFLQNQQLTSLLSPAVKIITNTIRPFTHKMQTPTLHNNILTAVRKYHKQHGKFGYHLLKGLEAQPRYPLHKLLLSNIGIQVLDNTIVTSMLLDETSCPQPGPLLTEFCLEAILITGNPLRQEELPCYSQQSELFSYNNKPATTCQFSFQHPGNTPWMLLLKMTTFEGKQFSTNPKYHALKVIETG